MATVKNARFSVGGIEDLTVGLFLDGSPVNSPPGSADIASNVLYSEDGSLQARPGLAARYTYPAGYTTPYLIQRVYRTDSETLLSIHNEGWAQEGRALARPTADLVTQIVSASKRTLLLTGTALYNLEGETVYAVDTPGVAFTNTAPAGGTLTAGSYTYSLALRDSSGYETGVVRSLTVAVPANGGTVLQVTGVQLLYPTAVVYRKDPGSAVPLYIGTISLNSGAGNLSDNGLTTTGLTVQNRTPMGGGQAACFSANRLWVVNQNVLTYSDTGSPFIRGNFNSEPINLPDGGNVTAIAPFNQGVIVFGLHSALYFTGAAAAGGSILPLALTDGCLHQHCWTQVDGQLAFCGKQDIYVMNGQQATSLGYGVRKLIRTASPNSLESTLVYSPRRQLLSLSLPTQLLTIQIRKGKPRAATWAITSYPQTIYMDDVVVAQPTRLAILNGVNDEGAGVQASWRSTPQSFGAPQLWKLLRRAEVLLQGGGAVSGYMSVGEAFGDGSPDVSSNVSNIDSPVTELRIKLSVPTSQQGNFLRFGINFTTTDTGATFATAPIVCEYRARERLGRS